MKKSIARIALLALLLGSVICFFTFDLGSHLNLSQIKAQQESFNEFYMARPALALSLYFAIYVLTSALSVPGGATLLTLLGGALFGLTVGTLVVSFASTTGATLAFLSARFLFRDAIQNRFGKQLESVNAGMKKDGATYLFSLRLIPAVPFFVVNLVMGLTPLRVRTFFFVSQVGMLPGTLVYVNAGTQLGQLESLQGILSPTLILSFVLLGLFPLLAKKAFLRWTQRPL